MEDNHATSASATRYQQKLVNSLKALKKRVKIFKKRVNDIFSLLTLVSFARKTCKTKKHEFLREDEIASTIKKLLSID